LSEGHIERIIANTISETARGDPDALAARIVTALGKAGYRIVPANGMEDTALGSQPFGELRPEMRPQDIHGWPGLDLQDL
jgi:predicted CoA-binding protein